MSHALSRSVGEPCRCLWITTPTSIPRQKAGTHPCFSVRRRQKVRCTCTAYRLSTQQEHHPGSLPGTHYSCTHRATNSGAACVAERLMRLRDFGCSFFCEEGRTPRSPTTPGSRRCKRLHRSSGKSTRTTPQGRSSVRASSSGAGPVRPPLRCGARRGWSSRMRDRAACR